MRATNKLTKLQLELLKIFSFEISDEQMKEIKSLLSAYFANKVTSEMDSLFQSNSWDQEKIDEWAKEHMRTKTENK